MKGHGEPTTCSIDFWKKKNKTNWCGANGADCARRHERCNDRKWKGRFIKSKFFLTVCKLGKGCRPFY